MKKFIITLVAFVITTTASYAGNWNIILSPTGPHIEYKSSKWNKGHNRHYEGRRGSHRQYESRRTCKPRRVQKWRYERDECGRLYHVSYYVYIPCRCCR